MEATHYELIPQYDSRKSFYRKAIVEVSEAPDGVSYILLSYNTPVAFVHPALHYVQLFEAWDYSPTTLRHVREFLAQMCGEGFFKLKKRDLARLGEFKGWRIVRE